MNIGDHFPWDPKLRAALEEAAAQMVEQDPPALATAAVLRRVLAHPTRLTITDRSVIEAIYIAAEVLRSRQPDLHRWIWDEYLEGREDCPTCGPRQPGWMAVMYPYDHPEYIDGISEWRHRCGYRRGRFSGRALTGEEFELRHPRRTMFFNDLGDKR